jgi:DNA-binding NtrC family response regulator
MFLRTVLIVDDEPLIRLMLTEVLEDEGYQVVQAKNALEAIVALEARKIDAVITDVEMPCGINGVDLARHIATVKPGISVIVTSAGRSVSSGELPHGVRFIPKPYDVDFIIATLSALLSSHSQKSSPLLFRRGA